MIQQADEIVIATAVRSHAELLYDGDINTIVELQVEQVLKGGSREGDTLRLYEPDGFIEELGIGTNIPGVPRYDDGQRYLVFAGYRNNGRLVTWGFSLGRFSFMPADTGETLLVRSAGFGFDANNMEPYTEQSRDAVRFLAYIRGIIDQSVSPVPDYFVDARPVWPKHFESQDVGALATATSYLASGSGRWPGSTVQWRTAMVSSAPPSTSGTSGANSAFNAWTNDANSNITYSNQGNDDTLTKGLLGGQSTADGKNTILYGDPNNELTGPYAGALGLGGQHSISGSLTNTVNGETFNNALEGDVIVKANFGGGNTQACLNVVLTHELGHTLGFRHADMNRTDTGPCASPLDCSAGTGTCGSAGAIMTSCTNCAFSATLQNWDKAAVGTMYPGAGCTPPTINTHPQSTTITSGPTTLTVSAGGTNPLSYQWYTGNPPSTSNPIGGATNLSVQVSPTNTTTYWVQVTNACGTVNSNAATVTVQTGCPTITVGNPAGTDLGNGSFSLSVTASGGSGLTFTWFEGGSVGSGSPVGTGNPLTINNVSSARTFWVQVQNNCGNTQNSPRTVTIGSGGACVPVAIVTQPVDQSVLSGGTVQLSFETNIATSPVTVKWFSGTPPDQSNQIGSAKIVTSPAITTTSNFYATASNACGNVTSRTVTVTVTQICTAPTINSVSANPAAAAPGTLVTLAVDASGTSLTYQWFRGNSGDTSNPIEGATASTITDTPTATSSYWVRVSSGCGAAAANSQTVVVTVTTQCVPPSLVQPTNPEIIFGTAATLTASTTAGTAPLHYAWFQGAQFDTSHPVGTDSATLTTATLTSDTQFFVNVSNSCGNVNSETITVKVKIPRRRPTGRR